MRRSSQKRRNLVIELRRVTTDRYVDIPGGVLDVYRLWRPSPLFRAHRLEQALDTPARIYDKYEGVSPAGSHQTIIGEEALLQMAMIGEVPDVLVGCTGGGSNFGGLSFPFLREKLAGKMDPIIRCVEPAACPSLTRGEYRYDFGDTLGVTPLMKMHTLGHDFIPASIHAGGLRYHGMAPLVSHIYELGLAEAEAIPQTECFAGALTFARCEGIVPAPEPTHAIAAAIREAQRCKESGEEKVILTALCGHGHLDLASYEQYLAGEMEDYDLTSDELSSALSTVPVLA